MSWSRLVWAGSRLAPYSAIVAVMRFFGYTEAVVGFHNKSEQVPLNMQSSLDSPSTPGPRTRLRGVPMAHAPERLIGEKVHWREDLFAMDLIVNQQEDTPPHLPHNDVRPCGRPELCARA